MAKTWYSYVKNRNLVDRICAMLEYLEIVEYGTSDKIKNKIKYQLKSIYYVENLAKLFEENMRSKYINIESRYNLKDLIYDLNNLKQYLCRR